MFHVHVHDDLLHAIWIARAVFILLVLYLWDLGRSDGGNWSVYVCLFVCLLPGLLLVFGRWGGDGILGDRFWIGLGIKDGAFGDVPEIRDEMIELKIRPAKDLI